MALVNALLTIILTYLIYLTVEAIMHIKKREIKNRAIILSFEKTDINRFIKLLNNLKEKRNIYKVKITEIMFFYSALLSLVYVLGGSYLTIDSAVSIIIAVSLAPIVATYNLNVSKNTIDLLGSKINPHKE